VEFKRPSCIVLVVFSEPALCPTTEESSKFLNKKVFFLTYEQDFTITVFFSWIIYLKQGKLNIK